MHAGRRRQRIACLLVLGAVAACNGDGITQLSAPGMAAPRLTDGPTPAVMTVTSAGALTALQGHQIGHPFRKTDTKSASMSRNQPDR